MNDRIPPHDANAERNAIGCLLMDPTEFPTVAGIITSEMFHIPMLRDIMSVMEDLERRRVKWTVAEVVTECRKKAEVPEDFDARSVLNFMEGVYEGTVCLSYARLVRIGYLRRLAISGATRAISGAYSESVEIESILECFSSTSRQIEELVAESNAVTLRQAVGDEMMAIQERQRNPRPAGLMSGLVDLDEITGGFRGLTVVAARPSMGKTALSFQIATRFAETYGTTLFFSLEQGRDEISRRCLASKTGIDSRKLVEGKLDSFECDAIVDASSLITERLIIDDTPNRNLRQIVAAVRLQKKKTPVVAVFIDYLQLMDPEDKRMPREQQVANLIKGLKNLTKTEKVAVVCLAQLNRETEKGGGLPKMSNLRESGSIEQDADQIVFIHRDEQGDATKRAGEADVLVSKNRDGNTGKTLLTYIKQFTRFENYSPFVEPVEFKRPDVPGEAAFWGDGKTYGR